MYDPKSNDKHRYDDIIDLPRPVKTRGQRMSNIDRAAQFAPFAALTGYDSAISETARLTDTRLELDEYTKSEIDQRLQIISDHIKEQPEISLTYFKPDKKKSGGAYVRVRGNVREIDTYKRAVILTDKECIPIDDIFSVDGELFGILEKYFD